LTGAARIVLRDWSTGKFGHYSTPPVIAASPEHLSSPGADLTALYAQDETILAALPTRKEMRKQQGLVKFSPGSVDQRKAKTEEDWAALEDSEDEEGDDDNSAEDDDEGVADGGEEEEEEEAGKAEVEEGSEEEEDDSEETDSIMDEDEEDDILAVLEPMSKKQKRKRGPDAPVPARPTKKVSFGRVASTQTKKGIHKVASKQKPLTPLQAQPTETKNGPHLKTEAPLKPRLKSSLKASPAVTRGTAERKTKVANTKLKNNPVASAPKEKKDGKEPEAYDFGKFF